MTETSNLDKILAFVEDANTVLSKKLLEFAEHSRTHHPTPIKLEDITCSWYFDFGTKKIRLGVNSSDGITLYGKSHVADTIRMYATDSLRDSGLKSLVEPLYIAKTSTTQKLAASDETVLTVEIDTTHSLFIQEIGLATNWTQIISQTGTGSGLGVDQSSARPKTNVRPTS